MLLKSALFAVALVGSACASPAEMAKDQLGRGECADRAEQRCEEDLAGSDRFACLKREIFLCEELAKTGAP